MRRKKTTKVRRTKKHKYNIGDPVVYKFIGEKFYGRVRELRNTKEGYALYYVQTTHGRLMEVGLDKDYDVGWIDSSMSKSIKLSKIKDIVLPHEKQETTKTTIKNTDGTKQGPKPSSWSKSRSE